MIDQETTRDSAQATQLAEVRSDVKKLSWRVGQLKKDMRRAPAVGYAADPKDEQKYADLQQRLGDLERALQEHSRKMATSAAATSAPEIVQPDAELTKRVGALADNINQLRLAQQATQKRHGELESGLKEDRELTAYYLKALEAKVGAIEAAQAKAGAAIAATKGNDALAQRVAKLDASLSSAAQKHDKLTADLEKDRTLVVDYLEDLMGRIEKLEESAKKAPVARSASGAASELASGAATQPDKP